MKSNKKRIRRIIILILIIGIAVALYFFFRSSNVVTTTLNTKMIEVGVISNSVTATGTIEPISTVEVGTQVSGNIDKLYVDYNSVVKKGQLLAELDKTVLLSTLKTQENSLASAENELDYQKKNYERTKGLYEKKLVSDSEYETAEYQYKTALYSYNRAKEQVVTAETNLSYATIYSPIDGVVLSKSVQEGQTVAASFSTPTLFTIAEDLTQMQVIADVDEADIGQVKEGQSVEFTVDAFPDDVFSGTVTQIRLEAQVTSNVVTYNVVIEAPNPELKLMPGLTANINIYTLYMDSVLLLPVKAATYMPSTAEAPKKGKQGPPPDMEEGNPPADIADAQFPTLSQNNNENTKMVWLKDGDNKKPCRVSVGISDGINYQVLDGLKEGDVVIISESKVVEKAESAAQSSPLMPGPPDKKK